MRSRRRRLAVADRQAGGPRLPGAGRSRARATYLAGGLGVLALGLALAGVSSGWISSKPAARPIAETNIVDRAGVPESLHDKYWIAANGAGQVGTTARVAVPEDEVVLGADAGRVASYRVDPATSRPVVGPAGVRIIVRDIRSGAITGTFDTPVRIASGLMVGSVLFWTGQTLPATSQGMDAGVWALNLDLNGAAPIAVIPPSDLSLRYGADAVRGPVRLTDNGRTIVTLVQGPTRRGTDVMSVANLSFRDTLLDMYAFEVMDETALVIPLHGDEGKYSREIRTIDLTTRATIGSGVPTEEVAWAFAGGGSFFVQHGIGGTGYGVTAIESKSGAWRDVLSNLTLSLSHNLSSPDSLALVPLSWDVDSSGTTSLPVSLLDPLTGRVQPNAFRIGDR
jgi:hypothetical protein